MNYLKDGTYEITPMKGDIALKSYALYTNSPCFFLLSSFRLSLAFKRIATIYLISVVYSVQQKFNAAYEVVNFYEHKSC